MRRYLPHAFLILAALLLMIRGVHAGLNASDWASWVQAIGSIAAILGAFWISDSAASNARKHEAERRNAADALKTELICEIFQEGRHICFHLGNVTGPGPIPHDFQERVERCAEIESIIRDLPLFDLPGRLVALPVLEAPKALADLRRYSQQYVDARINHGGVADEHVPERLRVDLGRVHANATGICDAGFTECQAQMKRLRSGNPDAA